MAVIFVNMRNDEGDLYRSYIDYWKLVDLSGFARCELNEVDRDSDNTYIFSPVNGNTINFINHEKEKRKARFIAWELERPNKGVMHKRCDETWFYDRAICEKYGLKYVVVGGHPDLGGEKQEPVYDFANMAYIYGKRESQCNQLKAKGYGMSPNSWAYKDRNLELSRSKWGLCLHQDEEPVIEPLRFTLFSCWKLPLIVEYSHSYGPYEVQLWDKPIDHDLALEQAERNYTKLTQELTFRKCVEDALKD